MSHTARRVSIYAPGGVLRMIQMLPKTNQDLDEIRQRQSDRYVQRSLIYLGEVKREALQQQVSPRSGLGADEPTLVQTDVRTLLQRQSLRPPCPRPFSRKAAGPIELHELPKNAQRKINKISSEQICSYKRYARSGSVITAMASRRAPLDKVLAEQNAPNC